MIKEIKTGNTEAHKDLLALGFKVGYINFEGTTFTTVTYERGDLRVFIDDLGFKAYTEVVDLKERTCVVEPAKLNTAVASTVIDYIKNYKSNFTEACRTLGAK